MAKKSQCANALCADSVKECNSDDTCRNAAFKVMCLDFSEHDGSIFYETLVKGDDTNSESVRKFGQCMKDYCFEDTDDEVKYEYESQTTVDPRCVFGYAKFEAEFKLCMESTGVGELCKVNYALNFRSVVATDKEAQINWFILEDGCNSYGIEDKRRLQDLSDDYNYDPEIKWTTTSISNPWDHVSKSTELPEEVPTSLKCIKVSIVVTYPTLESYQTDKEKYQNLNIEKLNEDAEVTIVGSYSIECCKEDEVCQNVESSSLAISTFLALVAVVTTLLFV